MGRGSCDSKPSVPMWIHNKIRGRGSCETTLSGRRTEMRGSHRRGPIIPTTLMGTCFHRQIRTPSPASLAPPTSATAPTPQDEINRRSLVDTPDSANVSQSSVSTHSRPPSNTESPASILSIAELDSPVAMRLGSAFASTRHVRRLGIRLCTTSNSALDPPHHAQ